MYIILKDSSSILEVTGNKLQSFLKDHIEDVVKTENDPLLKNISNYFNSQNLDSSFVCNDGEVKCISLEEDFTEYGLEAFAKYPSSTSCPGTYGGMGQGSTMSDDNTCLTMAP